MQAVRAAREDDAPRTIRGTDRHGVRMRTGDLVQRLQIARRELALENALAKLDKYHLLILDDIVYVSKN